MLPFSFRLFTARRLFLPAKKIYRFISSGQRPALKIFLYITDKLFNQKSHKVLKVFVA
jgi:hypothetical protein